MDVDDFYLLDLPDETLLHIFGYFDDRTSLSAIRVCKKFKRLTEVAVAEKYDGKRKHKYYEIEEFDGTKGNVKNEIEQHSSFLMAFAGKMNAVCAIFIYGKADKKHWIIRLLKRHLKSVSKICLRKSCNYFGSITYDYTKLDLLDVISTFPMLTSLELSWIEPKDSEWTGLHTCSLVELVLNSCLNVDSQTFQRFLNNNPQLENIEICNMMNITIDIFSGMPNLEVLDLVNDGDADESIISITDESNVDLPSLLIISTDGRNNSVFHVIGTGCKNIESFTVHKMNQLQKFEIDDHQVNIICSLKRLSNISMNGVSFQPEQVKKIVTELPKLKRIEFAYNGDISRDSIGNILKKTKQNRNLRLIKIEMENTHFESLPAMSEIHQAFKEFASRNITLKLGVGNWKLKKTVVITNENVFVNGKLVYWTGHSEILKPSKQLHFIQLNEKCLEIVINQLNFGDRLALYQTCAKMQELVGPKLKEQFSKKPFSILRDLRLEETYLRHFGKYISGIHFDYKICHDDEASKHWKLIQQHCNKTLEELTVKRLKSTRCIKDLNNTGLQFLNLKKLVFVKSNLVLFHPSKWNYSFCPKLTHLEFDEQSDIYIHRNTNLPTINFDNLTTLRFGWFCYGILLFLRALSQTVCENLRELSLVNGRPKEENHDHLYKLDHGIANTVARFRKLKKLDLILVGIKQTNMKFLFESCSNLEELSIFLVKQSGFFLENDRLEIIKKSCIHLKKLKIVIKRSTKKYFLKSLREVLGIFPGISIEVLEMNGESTHHFQKYNLTYELLNRWNKSPIQTFLSATE